jgi:aerobic carbon-monoxide dehydrogenase small subunit
MPVAAVENAEITTVEGLGPPGDLTPLQAAFHAGYAAQCGFCTPGMLIAAHALLERAGGPVDRDQVLDALSGHFCRCTGYVKIVDAVVAASRGEVGAAALDEMLVAEAAESELEIKGSPA